MRMGDMGPRGAINMGGRDMIKKGFCNFFVIPWGNVYAVCVVSSCQKELE